MTAPWLWIGLGATLLGAVFSALAHSLRDLSRSGLEEMAAQRGGPAGAARIARVLADLPGHSAAVALPRIVCHLIVAVAAVFWSTGLFGLENAEPMPAALGVAGASIVLWIFGYLLPRSIAEHAAERTVYSWSVLLRACHVLLTPLLKLGGFFDEVVRRLAGRRPEQKAEEIEAELLSVVEEGKQEGQFDQFESDMFKAVVEFRSITVEQIMTPRTEIEALELTNNLGAITAFIRSSRHSRIPVYEGNLDTVVGMFYIKDLMHWLAGDGSRSGKPFELKTILRPALFVPETKTIRELLSDLIRRNVHVAMVADEYGGTSGLVTIEDIVEEIFGEIRDEYELEEDEAPEVSVLVESKTAEIDARAYIDDANDALRAIGVELPEGPEYDTVGGLVITRLGRIPPAGEALRVGAVLMTVLEAEPTRVARVKIEVTEPLPEEPAPAAAEIETPAREPARAGRIAGK
jgi:putative hemolysin